MWFGKTNLFSMWIVVMIAACESSVDGLATRRFRALHVLFELRGLDCDQSVCRFFISAAAHTETYEFY